jgi:DNA-binding response OmpR family regulator
MTAHLNPSDSTQAPEILVVDDQEEIAEMLAEALADEGYRVRVASDGLSALQSIQHRQPDLLILDVMMPRMRGDQLVCRLRSDGATQLPIILMTADRAPERYAGLGASALLRKPFDMGALLATVGNHIGSRMQHGMPCLSLRSVERELGA